MKKETGIILGVLIVLIALPGIAVASMTNIGALAAGDGGASLYTGTASTANTYDYGFCTFWVAQRRQEVGLPIPNTWGDAHTWDDRAAADGYFVDHSPTKYSIMQTDAGDLGHVAFVENVDTNGNWEISEMNAKGWDIVDNRTLKPSDAKNYNFIH